MIKVEKIEFTVDFFTQFVLVTPAKRNGLAENGNPLIYCIGTRNKQSTTTHDKTTKDLLENMTRGGFPTTGKYKTLLINNTILFSLN
jgi:hypothetical protein